MRTAKAGVGKRGPSVLPHRARVAEFTGDPRDVTMDSRESLFQNGRVSRAEKREQILKQQRDVLEPL